MFITLVIFMPAVPMWLFCAIKITYEIVGSDVKEAGGYEKKIFHSFLRDIETLLGFEMRIFVILARVEHFF